MYPTKFLLCLFTTIGLACNAAACLCEHGDVALGFINAVLLGANLFAIGKSFE